jgi:hypothetical protein
MLDFGGRSFFFYHNGALPGGGSYKRSVCIEEFTYNADGSIPAIPPTDGGVTEGVGNLSPFDTVQAETICWESGIKTAPCSEGGIMVESINNGDYIKVEGADFDDGADTFEVRVASGGNGGAIELRLDSEDGALAGTCEVEGTGGWEQWTTVECSVSEVSGIHDLYLKFTGGSGDLFNCNWWRFSPVPVGIQRSFAGALPAMERPVVSYDPLQRRVAVDYAMQRPGMVKITLYDQHGRTVAVIDNGKWSAGYTRAVWNAEKLSGGIYIWKMVVDGRNRASGNVIAY